MAGLPQERYHKCQQATPHQEREQKIINANYPERQARTKAYATAQLSTGPLWWGKLASETQTGAAALLTLTLRLEKINALME